MSKWIKTHNVIDNDPNDLKIRVVDEPGPGGAHHVYNIFANMIKDNNQICSFSTAIAFQKGPIFEHGINGVTNEALLALVIHRLECLQAGPFACHENQEALDNARLSLEALKNRTRERLSRNLK
jgi:hypothetical protein